MPTLRRSLLALVLGSVCAGPALADDENGDGKSIRISGDKFEGRARFIDSERMSIALDDNRHTDRGSTPQHSRIVYNLRTGRAVWSEDVAPDSKNPSIKRYERTLRPNLSPTQVVSSLTFRPIGWKPTPLTMIGRTRTAGSPESARTAPSSSGFISKVKSLLFNR